jgi:uncharacterized membrane protein YtjA (UPF0391 family)
MLSYPVLLLFAALISGWAGFGLLTGNAARLAKFLCVAFLGVFAFFMLRGEVK